MPAPSPAPAASSWLRTSALVTLGATALVAVAIWSPWPELRWLLLGAVALFVWLVLHDPNLFLRRLATACVGFAIASGTLPIVDVTFDFGLAAGFLKSNETIVAPTFLTAAVAFSIIEVIREHLRTAGPRTHREPIPAQAAASPELIYDIFLAHADGDAEHARTLYTALTRSGVKVFFRETELQLGDDRDVELPRALATSRIIVALVSRVWSESQYEQRGELVEAFSRARARDDSRVVPVYLDDSPPLFRYERVESARVAGPAGRTLADVATELLALLDRLRDPCAKGHEGELGTENPAPEPLPESRDELPPVLSEWLDEVVWRNRKIPLLGFEREIAFPVHLDDIYVTLHARQSMSPTRGPAYKSGDEAKELAPEHGQERVIEMSQAFSVARSWGRRGKRGVVLLGDPGSGKTTQLTQALTRVARAGAASMGLPESTMPVLLRLRELDEVPTTFDALVEDLVTKAEGEHAPVILEQLAKHEPVLYLVDGLDEVRDTEARRRVSRAIETAIESRRPPFFMVTCRYAGYEDETRLDARFFVELRLQPLDELQVARYVDKWFGLVEEHAGGDDPDDTARRAQAKAHSLVRALRQPRLRAKSRVFELTRNPLLLTAICLVHLDRDRIPEKTTELYRECLDVMLDRWRLARSASPADPRRSAEDESPSSIPAPQAQQVIRPVARWLHEQRVAMATAAELRPVLGSALADAGLDTDPDSFLQAIREEVGLFTGWSGDRYGLMHLGLQEYLTAQQVALLAAAGNTLVLDHLAERFGDSWWEEVVLLLVGLRRPDGPSWFEEIMKRVVDVPAFAEPDNTKLVDQCLADAHRVSAGPFIAVAQRSAEHDEGLWARQRAALRVLDGLAPEHLEPKVLDELAKELQRHLHPEVKAWAVERLRKDLETMIAEPGGYEMVRIPGGTFLMGSPEGDEMAYSDEQPQHEVMLSDFYLGRHPVTNEEYGRFLKANPRAKEPEYWGDRNYNQPRQPVVGVSWEEAMAYCEWTGLTLPTEAQWEYACRAGTTTRYWSGDTKEDLARVGWYDGNSGGRLHAVAELEPNEFGLYDMHGNIGEWCRDGWASNYEGLVHHPGDGLHTQPVGVALRVVRGGDYWRGIIVDARSARSAYRDGLSPESRYLGLGFRPARVIP